MPNNTSLYNNTLATGTNKLLIRKALNFFRKSSVKVFIQLALQTPTRKDKETFCDQMNNADTIVLDGFLMTQPMEIHLFGNNYSNNYTGLREVKIKKFPQGLGCKAAGSEIYIKFWSE